MARNQLLLCDVVWAGAVRYTGGWETRLCSACAAKWAVAMRETLRPGESLRMTPSSDEGEQCQDCESTGDPTLPGLVQRQGQWVVA